MNARNKVNVAYANGCLAIAALVGMMAGSWAVFLMAFVALVVGSYASGEIRTRRKGRSRKGRRSRLGSGRGAGSLLFHSYQRLCRPLVRGRADRRGTVPSRGLDRVSPVVRPSSPVHTRFRTR